MWGGVQGSSPQSRGLGGGFQGSSRPALNQGVWEGVQGSSPESGGLVEFTRCQSEGNAFESYRQFFVFFCFFFPLTDDEMVYLYFNQSCTVKLLFVVSVNGPPFHSEGACIERASDPRRPSFKDLGWYKNYGDS